MSRGLPGFDHWLTTPPDDGPEPSDQNWRDARDLLGPDASEDQIEEKAYQLMEEEIDAARQDAEEAEAESRLDDREDYNGP